MNSQESNKTVSSYLLSRLTHLGMNSQQSSSTVDMNSQESNTTLQMDDDYIHILLTKKDAAVVNKLINDLIKDSPTEKKRIYKKRYEVVRERILTFLDEIVEENAEQQCGSEKNKGKGKGKRTSTGDVMEAGPSEKRKKGSGEKKKTEEPDDVMTYLDGKIIPLLHVDYPEFSADTSLQGIINHLQLLQNKYNHCESRLVKDGILIGSHLQMAFDMYHKGKKKAFRTFLKDNVTLFSESYCYFLIELSNLCEVYPRLSFCGVPIGYLQKNFKNIKDALSTGTPEMKDYWKYPPARCE
jgi:hypothetical protein